ncbi:hypothetical protein FUA23_11355 [Neolewinella aurantiaca]|uniref:Uncharacterized protein n=1 Tax=Neolewinella aurantiaca TaxID=2602767 RepID=A0A5C7FE43_9BACT|nr:hypothetical protein [Neolewinella aurantiaca]TXF89334.1 hypothetical protein FUA23_11355 [Neolewinella aurantiaca]
MRNLYLLVFLYSISLLHEINAQSFDLGSTPPCIILKVDTSDIGFLTSEYEEIIRDFKFKYKGDILVFETGVNSGMKTTFLNVAKISLETKSLKIYKYQNGVLVGKKFLGLNGYVLQSIENIWLRIESTDYEIFPLSLGRGQDDKAYLIVSTKGNCSIYTRGVKIEDIPSVMQGEAGSALTLIKTLLIDALVD